MSMTVLYPSGTSIDSTLECNLGDLTQRFKNVHLIPPKVNELHPFTAGSPEQRAALLEQALKDPQCNVILSARGGYGASDVLPLLPWEVLQSTRPRLLCGFSDISALLSAFFTELGWYALHCPMPDSKFWGENTRDDLDMMFDIITGNKSSFSIPCQPIGETRNAQGWLFGGNLAVLSNLIGTPWFPELQESIVVLEDIAEPPQKILLNINHWIQSGSFEGVEALVLGSFTGLSQDPREQDQFYSWLCQEIANRVAIPTFVSQKIGHSSPNFPFVLGAEAYINQDHLNWTRPDLLLPVSH